MDAVTAPAPAGRGPRESKPLGQRLVEAGLLSEPQLDLALREQRRSGAYLGQTLVELGFVSEEEITRCLAAENDVEVVSVRGVTLAPEMVSLIDYEVAREHKAFPLSTANGLLQVVFADPLDVVAQDDIERRTGYPIEVVTAPEAHVLEVIERNFSRSATINETIEQVLSGGLVEAEDVENSSPMVRLVDQILATGIQAKATDIHLQPEVRNMMVRLRVDGLLREELIIPKALQSAVIARLKLMAGLDITEKRVPQDGRIKFTFGANKVDLRVSTLPINNGESIVMRILESDAARLSFDQLGLSTADLARLSGAINHPFGMVLVTGPTGSGKTTTLYTALGSIERETRSVFTLEDPIEYQLPLVRQSQINTDVGLDFATGLRALLRQDPDVILVGEIRDLETAQLATRAALTGHLVFSTLHTNSAVAAIPRLVDMGIDRYLLPSALVAIVGQRLLRRLCQDCRRPADRPAVEILGPDLEERATTIETHWEAVGCSNCGNSGYTGRIAVYEVLLLNDAFHDAILNGAKDSDLERLGRANGMTTMLEDGLAKAAAGETTLSEVVRVLR
ncbi:MAG: ATPase, T2SS/T4P/T4SS family [Pseudomonadota bacterium]